VQALDALESPEALALTLTLEDGTLLNVQTAVRVVPKKRVVALAEWQGKAVYAKLFWGEGAQHYAQRDAKGVDALQAANLATPALLYQGQAEAEACQVFVLLLVAHAQAENAQTLYQRATPDLQKRLALKLVKTLAQHHQANVLQTDLYFKNFIIDQGQVLTIDGDGIRSYQSLAHQQKQHNLAVLLSKIEVLSLKGWLPELIAAYQAVQVDVDLTPEALFAKANQVRLKQAIKFADHKVFRQCTDVQVHQQPEKFTAIARDFVELPLPESVEAYDALIESGQWLKQGNTASVAFAQIGPIPTVVKRYNIKNKWHAISRAWRPSRAATYWANAHRLLNLGIKTPQPIALYEARTAGVLRHQAYVVTRYLDAPDMAEFFQLTRDSHLRASAVKRMVELLLRLSLLKLSHGDLKANNIKVLPDGSPVLIDLDSMQQHRFSGRAQKGHVKDLKRFMKNWQGQQALYNAFLKNFKVIYSEHAPLVTAGLITV